jgi:hypothetical protein
MRFIRDEWKMKSFRVIGLAFDPSPLQTKLPLRYQHRYPYLEEIYSLVVRGLGGNLNNLPTFTFSRLKPSSPFPTDWINKMTNKIVSESTLNYRTSRAN